VGYDKLDPQEDLVNYFERVSGHSLRGKADLDRYLDYARDVRPSLWLHVNRVSQGWALVKQLILVLLFAVALGQYIFLDVFVEVASLQRTVYFVSSNRS